MRSNGDKRTGKTLVDQARTRRAKGWTGRVVIGTVALATVAGVIHTASAASSDPASTYAGTHLTVQQAATAAYNAGFHTENQLLAVVAIGIAESGLVTQTRNWHPEFGYRPTSANINVQGPPAVWNGNQQMHADRGAWQISSHWWPQYTDAQTDDPASAARIMFSISQNGSDFSPWDTYKEGDAQQYYDGSHGDFPAIRPVIQQVIATGGGGGAAAPAAAPRIVTAPKPVVNKAPTTTVPKKVAAKPAAKPAAPKPAAKPAVAAPAVGAGNEIRHSGAYVTAYDWQDNNPPNSAEISNPVIHQKAGGTGTFADPLTVAISRGQFAWGTKFYVPNLRAYVIAEDTIGDGAQSPPHLDIWAGGQTSSQSSAYNCMSHVTGDYLVIQNPASNYAVVPGPLSANSTCRQLFGNTVVTTGAAAPVVTKPATPAPVAKPKPPAPVPVPTPAVKPKPAAAVPTPAPVVNGGSGGSGGNANDGTHTRTRSRHRHGHRRYRSHSVRSSGSQLCISG